MLNFTIGPVMTWNEILEIGSSQIPYFRTSEFSEVMLDNEALMLKLSGVAQGSRCVFLTGSGTMGMEAAVINSIKADDKVLVVNGGSFGQRFFDICLNHGFDSREINLSLGEALEQKHLIPYEGVGITVLLVNLHETSTGVLYNLQIIKDFCKRNNVFLIVDAISAFMADEYDADGIDIMITSSQKAFACAPGVTMLVLSTKALERINDITCPVIYMDLKYALKNGERGQTPFTPAVLTLLQINRRLHMVEKLGGIKEECRIVSERAAYFRKQISEFPLELISKSPSNAITAIHPLKSDAKRIYNILKNEYGIWICPNGGNMADYCFRVGHIGNITIENIDTLIRALGDII